MRFPVTHLTAQKEADIHGFEFFRIDRFSRYNTGPCQQYFSAGLQRYFCREFEKGKTHDAFCSAV